MLGKIIKSYERIEHIGGDFFDKDSDSKRIYVLMR